MAELYLKLCFVIAACGSLAGVLLAITFAESTLNMLLRLVIGLKGFVFLILSFVYTWILMQRPCIRQSFTTVSTHFIISFMIEIYGRSFLSEMMTSCEDPMSHQRRLWQELLKRNGHTAYAEDYNLRRMKSFEDLRKLHPVTDYERFRPYVSRMMEGEKDVLIKGMPSTFVRSTGTTGKYKAFPLKKTTMKYNMRIGAMLTHVSNQCYPTNRMSKTTYLYVAPECQKMDSGCDLKTAGRLAEDENWFYAQFSAPAAGYKIRSMHDSFYVQLLFALMDKDMGRIIVGFLNFLESAMKLLEKEWPVLTRDIECGSLSTDLRLTSDIRKSLEGEMQKYGGDPARAAQLRKEFEKGFTGIIKRVWPRVPVILGVDTTGCWPRLSATYAKGLALLPGFYGCSEACEIAFAPGYRYIEKGYIPAVTLFVMEFIKEEEISSTQPQTFFLDELEKEQNYEIVLTSDSGLYRFRMGDVIRVIDFYKRMPVLDFMYRIGQMLNIRDEKLDQLVVSESVRAAAGGWKGRTLIEFAVAESSVINECIREKKSSPRVYEPDELMPYYIFFLEMNDAGEPLTADEKAMIDLELQRRSTHLARLHGDGTISHSRVHAVRPGAFAELERYILNNTGATANQYKVPRKLRTIGMIQVLLANVV